MVVKVTSRSLCFNEIFTSVTPGAERFYGVPNMYLLIFFNSTDVRSLRLRFHGLQQAVTLRAVDYR